MLMLQQSELAILTQKIVHLLRTQKRMKKKKVDQASSADIVAKLSIRGTRDASGYALNEMGRSWPVMSESTV